MRLVGKVGGLGLLSRCKMVSSRTEVRGRLEGRLQNPKPAVTSRLLRSEAMDP